MTASDTAARVTPLIEELFENSSTREQLRHAGKNLRASIFGRASR